MVLCILCFVFIEFFVICVAEDDLPKCGWISRVKFSIVDEDLIDFTNANTIFTANVTFIPIGTKHEQANYYVALIGYAFELNNEIGCLFGMKNVIERSTNCLEMNSTGHCLKTSGNSLIVSNLNVGKSYGIILCSIFNPANRELPDISYDDEKELPPFRVDRIYASLQRNAIKMISREGFLIFFIAAIMDFFVLIMLMYCCRYFYLRNMVKQRAVHNRSNV